MGVVNGMLKTIKVKDVRLGMYIHELKGPWMDHPFWRSKFVLKDPEDLQKLLASRIQEVVIDVSQGLDIAKVRKTLSEPPPQPALSDKELVMLELDGPAPSHRPPHLIRIDTPRPRLRLSESKRLRSLLLRAKPLTQCFRTCAWVKQ